MKSPQQAMEELSDFLGKLAKGCHVQVNLYVYAMGNGRFSTVADIVTMTSEVYFHEQHGDLHWLGCHRTINGWLHQLKSYNAIVVYAPPTNEEPKRQVRSVEL